MKIKSGRDFWSGLMFVLLGTAFAWGATSYGFGSPARPGPGSFPFGLGLLLALLGALVLFKSLTIETEDGQKIGAWPWRPLLGIGASVAVFGWALPLLGMAVALPLLVLLSAMAGNEFDWREALVSALVLTLGSWAVFVWALKLTIPLWPAFASH
jgi:hypothetical protein